MRTRYFYHKRFDYFVNFFFERLFILASLGTMPNVRIIAKKTAKPHKIDGRPSMVLGLIPFTKEVGPMNKRYPIIRSKRLFRWLREALSIKYIQRKIVAKSQK